MPKGNKYCPSYDCEICNTYPSMKAVKCEDVNENCRWRDFDFKNISFEQYLKENQNAK